MHCWWHFLKHKEVFYDMQVTVFQQVNDCVHVENIVPRVCVVPPEKILKIVGDPIWGLYQSGAVGNAPKCLSNQMVTLIGPISAKMAGSSPWNDCLWPFILTFPICPHHQQCSTVFPYRMPERWLQKQGCRIQLEVWTSISHLPGVQDLEPSLAVFNARLSVKLREMVIAAGQSSLEMADSAFSYI